jgi:hypothetical protein
MCREYRIPNITLGRVHFVRNDYEKYIISISIQEIEIAEDDSALARSMAKAELGTAASAA